MAVDGEAYTDKTAFRMRYNQLKQLGTPGLTKHSTVIWNEDLKKWENVWIIEYAAEDVETIVN